MEFLTSVFDWFRDADNRGAVQVLLAVGLAVIAWATGLLKWLVAVARPAPKGAPGQTAARQTATHGGVNIGGNARDVTTGGRRDDDPA